MRWALWALMVMTTACVTAPKGESTEACAEGTPTADGLAFEYTGEPDPEPGEPEPAILQDKRLAQAVERIEVTAPASEAVWVGWTLPPASDGSRPALEALVSVLDDLRESGRDVPLEFVVLRDRAAIRNRDRDAALRHVTDLGILHHHHLATGAKNLR